MKIKDVAYVGSYGYAQSFPKAVLPEFVFVGRSNVGKSSLINSLLNRKNIARTSNTPGKTRTANFYTVNEHFSFVDVPGYGYAQVSQQERGKWQKLIGDYLKNRSTLRGVVHIIDIRHKPSKEDITTSRTLAESGRPVCLAFNKLDKIKSRETNRSIGAALEVLQTMPDTGVVPFSALTGAGRQELWAWIRDRLSL